jgi:hypothetical protein
VISCHVIPAPHLDLVGLLGARAGSARPADQTVAPPAETTRQPTRQEEPRAGGQLSAAELAEMPVVRLRQLARQVGELELKGRAVSRANKQQLIAALVKAWQ